MMSILNRCCDRNKLRCFTPERQRREEPQLRCFTPERRRREEPHLLLLAIAVLFQTIMPAAQAQPTAQKALEQRLVRALGDPDPALLERAARRLGLAGMIRGLQGSRPVRRAILEAAPLLDRPWFLLPPLIAVMRDGRDRTMASQAAAAVLAITEGLRAPELERSEEIAPLRLELSNGLRRVAADRAISLDVRVLAVLALAQIGDVVPERDPGPLLAFLADPEPRIRETAVELFAAGAPAPVLARLARLVTEDGSMSVARAAAVALCARVSPQQPRRRGDVSRELEYSALRGVRAFSRIRQIVESLDATDDQLVDLARCLARSRSAEDRRALAQLRRRSPRLRRLLRHQR